MDTSMLCYYNTHSVSRTVTPGLLPFAILKMFEKIRLKTLLKPEIVLFDIFCNSPGVSTVFFVSMNIPEKVLQKMIVENKFWRVFLFDKGSTGIIFQKGKFSKYSKYSEPGGDN